MPGFTDKIKARFKAKFPKVNLSTAKLDAIVARVDAKTEADDDTAIDAALDAINEYTPFEEMAREEDRIRTLEAKAGKTKTPPAKPTEDDPNETPLEKSIKELLESQRSIVAEINSLKSEKATATRKEKLTSLLQDAPESYRNKVLKDFGRMKFETDDEFNEYLTDSEEDLKAFEQEQSNAGLLKDKPGGGKPAKPGDTKEVSAEMKEYLASQNNPAA